MDRLLEYAAHHPWLVGLALLAAAVVLAFELRTRRHEFSAMSPQELVRAMNAGALVLDLRKTDDYEQSHISGARSFNPADILSAGESLRKYKEKTIVAYCDNGSLGASAARQLKVQGFTKAFNLRGGLAAWRSEKMPLVKPAPQKGRQDGKKA